MEVYGTYESEERAKEAFHADRQRTDQFPAMWLLHRHLGGAVGHAQRDYFPEDDQGSDSYPRYIAGWRARIANCPWRAEMLAEIDAFTNGTEYPDTDEDVEALIHLAISLERCDAIEQLVPRLRGPIRDPQMTLIGIDDKALLPVIGLILSACDFKPEDEAVIPMLTRRWLLPYTFLTLRAAFSDLQLTRYCNLSALADLASNGVRLYSFDALCELAADKNYFNFGRAWELQRLAPISEEEQKMFEGTIAHEFLFGKGKEASTAMEEGDFRTIGEVLNAIARTLPRRDPRS